MSAQTEDEKVVVGRDHRMLCSLLRMSFPKFVEAEAAESVRSGVQALIVVRGQRRDCDKRAGFEGSSVAESGRSKNLPHA